MGVLNTELIEYQTALRALLESLEAGDGTIGTGNDLGTILPTRLSLINMVKIKLDELIPQGEGVVYDLEDEPNVSDPLDLYINGLLDEACKNVLQTAPKHLCPVKQSTESATADSNETKIGFVKCADDYLRLHSFRMQEWKRDVEDPIETNNPLYKQQGNKYTRGGINRPVLVINNKIITDKTYKVLEYYSVKDSHTIAKFLYIPILAAENLPVNLWDSLTWICAGKILQNISAGELAKQAVEQANLCYQNLR